jgi:hypothetical protein
VAGYLSPPILLSLFFFPQETNRWAVYTSLERAIYMSLWLHAICSRPKYNIQKRKRQHRVIRYHVWEFAGLTFPGEGGGVPELSPAWQ